MGEALDENFDEFARKFAEFHYYLNENVHLQRRSDGCREESGVGPG